MSVDVEKETAGSNNGREGSLERKITAALKWVRDLPMHVLITALAAEEADDNGVINLAYACAKESRSYARCTTMCSV